MSTADENLVCQNGKANCFCKIGYYSPSGDAAKNKDCTARKSVARVGVEYTLDPTYYKWEDGVGYKRQGHDWTPLTNPVSSWESQTFKDRVENNALYLPISSVRGSSNVNARDATVVQSKIDETQLSITGLTYDYVWEESDIADSSNSLAQDLITQLKIDFLTPRDNRYFNNMGEEHLVITDLTTYPDWSEWGDWSSCDKDSCTQTREKKCQYIQHSQIPCIEDPDGISPLTETRSCISNTCRKYAG